MRDGVAERRLVKRLKAGESAAVADLASQYGSRIYQLAYRCTRNREDAEEITQDVLVKVWRGIGRFAERAALSSWIHRITYNAAMSRLRARGPHAIRWRGVGARAHQHGPRPERAAALSSEDPRPERVTDVPDAAPRADETLLQSQLRDRFVDAMRELPEIYRAAVVLRDVRGFSTEQASAALGIKDQTLKSRLHRGRVILRERLADFSGGLTLSRAA